MPSPCRLLCDLLLFSVSLISDTSAALPSTAFEVWARASGVTASVELRQTAESRRGLFATAPVKAGSVILRVPNELLLASDTWAPADDDRAGKMIRERLAPPVLRPHGYLATVLMHERARQNRSKWATYIDVLPPFTGCAASSASSSSPPLSSSSLAPPPPADFFQGSAGDSPDTSYLTSKEQALLDEDWYGRAAFRRRSTERLLLAKEMYEMIRGNLRLSRPDLFSRCAYGPRAFRWALDMVQSRVFSLRTVRQHQQRQQRSKTKKKKKKKKKTADDGDDDKDNDDRVPALVPFADLFNHAWHPRGAVLNGTMASMYGYERSTGFFEVRADVDVDVGKEIFITYGPHRNMDTIINYNLIVRSNPVETISLDLRQMTATLPPTTCAAALLEHVNKEEQEEERRRDSQTAAATDADADADVAVGTLPFCVRLKLKFLRRLQILETPSKWGSGDSGGTAQKLDSWWHMKFTFSGFPTNLLSIRMLRLLILEPRDVLQLPGGESTVWDRLVEGSPITPDSEVRVHQEIVKGLDYALSMWPTSIHHDMARLRMTSVAATTTTTATTTRGKLFIAYRIEAKRIMHAALLRSLEAVHNLYSVLYSAQQQQQQQQQQEQQQEQQSPLLQEPTRPSSLWERSSQEWRARWEGWWEKLEETTDWEPLVYGTA